MQDLTLLGWRPGLALTQAQLDPNALLARVALEDRGGYLLWTAHGERRALLSGAARARGDEPPVVGDWVYARDADGALWIDASLPRHSHLTRRAAGRRAAPQRMAANVDTALILTSPNLDFNPGRLERYLIMARAGDVAPVVVLNKADLVPDITPWLQRCARALPSVPVVALSALRLDGLDALAPWLGEGQTLALVGSSGAGKSTLANALLGQQRQPTQAIRRDDDEGRHTTTARHLLLLDQRRGLLIDTPGLRELQLHADEDAVEEVFADLLALAQRCRFRDCTHHGEPGCHVQAAIDAGQLDHRRLDRFQKLRREAAFFEARDDVAQQRRHARDFSRVARAASRHKLGR